jgi:hypothetical protein
MVTVVIAIALLVIGLALVFYPSAAIDLVQRLPLPRDLSRQLVDLMGQQMVAWASMALSPILLIVGSLVPGI